jgi:hypothetical protein
MQPFGSRASTHLLSAFALVLPLAACGGKAETPPKAPMVMAEGRAPDAPERRCAVRVSPDRKLTEIISQQDGYGVLLPGGTWDVQCDESQILFASSDLLLHVSIVQGDPTGQADPERYLRTIYERSAEQLKAHGWEAGAPRVAEVVSPNSPQYRRLALFHEVLGVKSEGQALKSIHAWTTMRTKADSVLDYHVSWTGPEEAWQDGMLDGLGAMLLSFGPLETG